MPQTSVHVHAPAPAFGSSDETQRGERGAVVSKGPPANERLPLRGPGQRWAAVDHAGDWTQVS